MEVAKGICRLGSWAVNWYVVEDGGKLTVIDAGFPRHWAQVPVAAASLGRSVSDIEAVLLTHSHSDHVGLIDRLHREAGAKVMVHSGDAPVVRGEEKGSVNPLGFLKSLSGAKYLLACLRDGAGRQPVVREAVTFSDGEVLEVPGRPRVIHVPGHTPGSCALLLEARGVLFSGDALITLNPLDGSRHPQIGPRSVNTDSVQALRSLERFEGIAASVVLPGHGEPWTGEVAEALRLARAT